MTVTFIPPPECPGEAWNLVLDYRLGAEAAKLPNDQADKLAEFLRFDAPVLTISQTAEYVYAQVRQGAKVPAGLLMLGAQCAVYGAAKFIDALGIEGRGYRIAAALRREAGEVANSMAPWPDAKDDPEPRAEFMPAPEPAATEAAPAEAPATT